MSFYEEFLRKLVAKPYRGDTGEKLLTVFGGMIDMYRDAAIQAAYVGLIDLCPDDAVESHAEASLMWRIAGESIAALRERVKGRWRFWSELGPTAGLQAAIRLYTGLSTLRVLDQANDDWFSGSHADGEDTNTENASRHIIVIEQPHPYEDFPVIGPGLVVGAETLVGTTMTSSELSGIRRAYRHHRPANMVGTDIWLLLGGDTLADIHPSRLTYVGDSLRLPLQVSMVGYHGGPSNAHHHMQVGPHMIVGRRWR